MSTPCTIQYASTVATAGQTVSLADGTYTATAATNTGLCAVACLVFPSHTGSAGNPIKYQCQHYQACTLSGTSAATGAGYAFVLNNAIRYITVSGTVCKNFVYGCVSANSGANGATDGNDHLTFTWNNCNNVGLACVLGGAYSSDNLIATNSMDYVGSYLGYSTCPASNQNDHGLYLQAPRQTIENNTFGSHILCGWPIQLAGDTPGQPTTAIVVGNSFGDRSHVVGSSVFGVVILYNGTQNVTPTVDFENNAMYNSFGAYVACYSQTVTGNPSVTISYNAMGDNNALTNCLGTYTYVHTGNIQDQPIGFLVGPPSVQTDFEIHNTSIVCGSGHAYTGWVTDIVGVPRPNLFTNPDMGAYSCNSY